MSTSSTATPAATERSADRPTGRPEASAAWRPGSSPSDRRAGLIMQGVAAFGVVVTLVLAVVAWRFLGELDRNLDRSLAIGEDAAATLTETIDIADEVVVALDDGLLTIEATLDSLAVTSEQTTEVADSTARLAASLPATFDDVDAALATVESLGGTIDGALRTASRLPLGPDYDPEVPFPDAIEGLRGALAPLGDELADIAVDLEGFASGSDTIGADLADVRADVERTRAALADSDELLERYRATAIEAEVLARTTRGDAGRSLQLATWMIVPLTLSMLLSQFVPWWLGRRLASRPARTGTGSGSDVAEDGVA
ncbi:MAG: hypothetical protein ACLGHQ_09690 [Acidimicrobiia bacterium]